MSVRIGLTGSIGAGKSTVAQILRGWGVEVVDADALAREALRDPDVMRRLQEAFGDVIVAGEVDRPRLARIVFADDEARKRLESLVHPVVHRLRRSHEAASMSRASPPAVIVHDVPLLFETGLDREMDAVLVVDAPWSMRLTRLRERSGWTEQQAAARDAAQMPATEKRRRADVVVDNDGDLETLRKRLGDAFRRVVALAEQRRPGDHGPS